MTIMDIITIEGDALADLLTELVGPDAHGARIYRLRIARDGDAVKLKVNEGTWSPGYPHTEYGRPVAPTSGTVTGRMEHPTSHVEEVEHTAPELTDGQVEILRASIKLEGPFARGNNTPAEYDAAYAVADAAGLSEVLEQTAQFFTRHHFTADEISSTAETPQRMRHTVKLAYAR